MPTATTAAPDPSIVPATPLLVTLPASAAARSIVWLDDAVGTDGAPRIVTGQRLVAALAPVPAELRLGLLRLSEDGSAPIAQIDAAPAAHHSAQRSRIAGRVETVIAVTSTYVLGAGGHCIVNPRALRRRLVHSTVEPLPERCVWPASGAHVLIGFLIEVSTGR